MVTGNPHSGEFLEEDDFFLLDEVWEYAWEKDTELFRPEYITDRAIDVMREHNPERMIIHYMQPHHPFIPYFDGFESELHSDWLNPWRDIRIGKTSKEEKWDRYRENLHYVLEYVELLLNNMEADDVVISADHGEAVGEWGVYGHPDIPLRVLREVPWIRVSATDSGEYQPEFQPDRDVRGESEDESAEHDVDDTLTKLGYI